MSNQENISKETKKTRKKRSQRKSQQIKLAVIMIMVSVLVLSASTFAWYQLNNTANVTNMQFTAETMGKLQISDVDENGDNKEEYSNSLNLANTTGYNSANKILLPSTTLDGMTFVSPDYTIDGLTVEGVEVIGNNEISKYVYKKDFYLLSGEVGAQNPKTYDLKLDAGTITQNVKSGTYFVANDEKPYNAVNAVRISFVINNGSTAKIYEPNWNEHYTADVTKAIVADNVSEAGYGKYDAMQQKTDGTFETETAAGRDVSTKLGTITEGTPLKVTMYVWFEGMDNDCVSEIALTQIVGQIQFRAEEPEPTP